MLIILKNEQEANALAGLLATDDVNVLKGAILSSPVYVTDENGKYMKIEFEQEKGAKNE